MGASKDWAKKQLEDADRAEAEAKAKKASEQAAADKASKERARLAAQHRLTKAQENLAKSKRSARQTAAGQMLKPKEKPAETASKPPAQPKADPTPSGTPAWAKGKSKADLQALAAKYRKAEKGAPLADMKKYGDAARKIENYLKGM